MAVLRIVPNLASEDVAGIAAFYRALFELDLLMDQGWIATLGARSDTAQLSVVAPTDADVPVPFVSIEVDDLRAVFDRGGLCGSLWPTPRGAWLM